WNVVGVWNAVEASDLRLGGRRHECFEARLQVVRHDAFVEEKTQRGRFPVIAVILIGLPHGIAAVLGSKQIRREIRFFRVDDLGYSRALKLVEASPSGLQSVTFEMPRDDIDEVAFPRR